MTSEQLVEEVVKLNIEMIRRVSELTESISELTARVNDMITRTRIEAPEGKEKEFEAKISARIDKLEKRLNSFIIMMLPRRVRAPPPGPMM
jgi:TolA-binding protein